MKNLLTSLTLAAAGAIVLVGFKWVLTGNDSSFDGGLSTKRASEGASVAAASEPLGTLASAYHSAEAATRIVDPIAQAALERAIRAVEAAEANYASIERELETLEAEMDMLDPDADEFLTETFLIQAEPLLDRLIAAEEAVQQAKDVERATRAAVAEG